MYAIEKRLAERWEYKHSLSTVGLPAQRDPLSQELAESSVTRRIESLLEERKWFTERLTVLAFEYLSDAAEVKYRRGFALYSEGSRLGNREKLLLSVGLLESARDDVGLAKRITEPYIETLWKGLTFDEVLYSIGALSREAQLSFPEISRNRKVAILKESLEAEIARQDFERAAKLRDQIRDLTHNL